MKKHLIHCTCSQCMGKIPMPFGQFQGKALDNVPAKYLLWLLDNKKVYGNIKRYIQENREILEKE